MPIGPYSNFAECLADQKSKGHSKESASKICGMLEHKMKESKAQEWVNNLFPQTSVESNCLSDSEKSKIEVNK
mgnify:CR=1 FL=1